MNVLNRFTFILAACWLPISGLGFAQDTQPATAAQEPPVLSLEEISGVYCITGDRVFDDAIWNLDITGVSIRTYWNRVEPERGKYNWELLDTIVAKGREHNKKVKLFVLFGSGVPEWTGAKFVTGSTESKSDSAGAKTPVPWDNTLIAEQKKFIRVFAERYRNEPHVSFLHIAGPSSRWAELALPDNLKEVEGYSNEAILDAWKQIIDTWAEVRGNKRVSLSVSAAPPFYPQLGRDIVTYASGDPTDMNDSGKIGQDFLPQWCYLDKKFERSIRSVSASFFPKNMIGWQMWGATTWPTRQCDDFNGTMDVAYEVGSTLIEVYDADLNQPELAKKAEEIDAKIKQDLKSGAATRPFSSASIPEDQAVEKFKNVKPAPPEVLED